MPGIIRRSVGILRARNKKNVSNESFADKKVEYSDKADAIRKTCDILDEEISALQWNALKWRNLIKETNQTIKTRKTRDMDTLQIVSINDETVQRLETLVEQAKGYLELTERDIKLKQELVTQGNKNMFNLASILSRLEVIEYQKEVAESLQKAYRDQSSIENHIIERLDSKEFEREIRKMEYTTQAFLELNSENNKNEGTLS